MDVPDAFRHVKLAIAQWTKDALHLVGGNNPGFTRLGGQPLAKAPFPWPTWGNQSLSFLLQIKFSEINAAGQLPGFPKSGLMYVFYDQGQVPWGADPAEKDGWRVLFFPETHDLTLIPFPDDIVADARFPAKSLTPRQIATLPPWESDVVQSLKLNEEEGLWYLNEYQISPYQGAPAHQIGGFPSDEQCNDDMELDCQLAANGIDCSEGIYLNDGSFRDPKAKALAAAKDEWILLLQIASDDDTVMLWGDSGVLYFWIRKQDLAAQRFDDVWLVMQCS